MSAFRAIHDTQNSTGAATSFNSTVPAVAANNLLVVNLKFGGNVSNISVTDNASNTYAKANASAATVGGTIWCYQFYGVAVTGGAITITVSWTTSTTCRATFDEFAGGQHSNAGVFDKVATNTGTGATSSSVTLSPTASAELVVAGVGFSGTPSAVTAGTNYIIGNNGTSQATEYRRSATTSETAPLSWTGSVSWAEVAGAYIALSTPNAGNFFEAI